MTSGLFRRYLRCAAGSQGWVISPVNAHPGPARWWFARHPTADPSQSCEEGAGALLSGSSSATDSALLLMGSEGQGKAWAGTEVGRGPDRCLAGVHHLLTNLQQSWAEALTSQKCSKLTSPTTGL